MQNKTGVFRSERFLSQSKTYAECGRAGSCLIIQTLDQSDQRRAVRSLVGACLRLCAVAALKSV